MPRIGSGLLIVALLALNVIQARTLLSPDLNDYGRFWTSAYAVVQGQSPYLTRENLNAPHFILLTAPLGLMRPLVGLVWWAALSLGAALVTVWLVIRELRLPPVKVWMLVLGDMPATPDALSVESGPGALAGENRTLHMDVLV